jgi:hypothetical protein
MAAFTTRLFNEDTMSQTESDYLIRFFGRFVLAFPKDPDEQKKRLTLLAVDMTFNKTLGFVKHCPTLSAPRALVVPGSRPSDLSLMANDYYTKNLDELFVWNLDRLQIECEGIANDEVVLKKRDLIPDLGALSNGGSLDQAHLAPQAAAGPTAFSFTVHGGSIRPLQLEPTAYTFVNLENNDTVVQATPRPIADGIVVAVTLSGDDPLTFNVRAADGQTSKIVLARRALAGASPQVVTFANLCGEPDQIVDREFAAFYDVLESPGPASTRAVPKATSTLGMEVACYPMSQAAF